MRKLGGYGIAAVGAGAVAIMYVGSMLIAADDYSGQTYGDALKAISDAGKKAIIASRSGNTLSDDDCIVSHSQSVPWVTGDDFSPVTVTVLVDLNCNAVLANAKDHRNSAGGPAEAIPFGRGSEPPPHLHLVGGRDAS